VSTFRRTALLLTLPASIVAIALYAVPIAQVLALSVTEPAFGLSNYHRMFANAAVGRVVMTTLEVSLMTTALTVVASYIVAFEILHMSARVRRIALFLVLVPFWISVLVRAFSWITILRRQGILNTTLLKTGIISTPLELVYNLLGVTIGMVHYMIPFAALLLYANLCDIDQRIVQAARSLGARPATVWFRVWLPLSLPGIALSTLFVFVFSLGFLVTPALLGAGKVLMIAEYVSIQISNTARWDLATCLSTVLLLVVGALVFIAMRSSALRAAFTAKSQP
jgi:putative spermidine/putrescine transport system permease protein